MLTRFQSPHRTRQRAPGNVDLVPDNDDSPRGRFRGLGDAGGNPRRLGSIRGGLGGAVPLGVPVFAGGCDVVVREAGAVADGEVGGAWGDGHAGGGCGASDDLSYVGPAGSAWCFFSPLSRLCFFASSSVLFLSFPRPRTPVDYPPHLDRGQGLNNAVHDACTLCRALEGHLSEGTPLVDAMRIYEDEVVERGHEAVVASGQNSLMIHDVGNCFLFFFVFLVLGVLVVLMNK